MAWIVVPNLDEARDQLNARFPKRDKTSDGSIGDTRHQASRSSHNPDRTGNPEWADGDKLDEVRARDFDKDLNDEHGVTMEQVVQHWVALARAGVLWWVRYFIYNGRIWHKSDGYKTRVYTGSNKHGEHVHVNSDFTEKADSVTGTDWQVKSFGIKEDDMTPEQESKILKGKLTPDNALYAWLRGIANGTMPAQTPSGVDWSKMVAAPFPGLTQLGERLAKLERAVEQLGERPAQAPELDYDRLAAALLRGIAAQA